MDQTTPPSFENGAESQIFQFTYEGEVRSLGEYLQDRYRYGRSDEWRESFFPDRVRLNGNEVHASTQVQQGDRVGYLHLRNEEPSPPSLGEPLYEDEWLLALHKPDTIPVNPSGIYYFSSMALLAREYFNNPELTPLHRLDLETDGVVLFAKQRLAIKKFHRLFERKMIGKKYKALVHGHPPTDMQEIRGWIAPHPNSAIFTKLSLFESQQGQEQESITRMGNISDRGDFSEIELEPVTGKTNQLRVHLASIGHPIVGDKKYHPDEQVFLDWIAHRDFLRLEKQLVLPSQALQCAQMRLEHPFSGKALTINAREEAWEQKIGSIA